VIEAGPSDSFEFIHTPVRLATRYLHHAVHGAGPHGDMTLKIDSDAVYHLVGSLWA